MGASTHDYVKLAVRALGGHKFRAALTVLSITVGAFAIVLMSSLAESGLSTLIRGIEDLGGSRLIMVFSKPPERNEGKRESYRGGLGAADRDRVFVDLPHVAETSMYANLGTRDATTDTGARIRTDVIGADERFLPIYSFRMGAGRAFTREENLEHAKVCVVGHKTATRLWTGAGDAVGRTLVVDGMRCRVVGVLLDQPRFGVGFGFDWVDLIVTPLETAAESNVRAKSPRFLVKTDAPSANETVKRILNARLVERHHGVDDYMILDFSTFMVRFERMFTIMEVIVGFLAGIALLIGGVGVMNIMLVSVSERVREIGIRKALGATPFDIAAQFLVEATILASIGGLAGVGGGVAAAVGAGRLIHHFLPTWLTVVATGAVVTALAVSFGIGVVFGWFPARRGSLLDPVDAMRR